MNYRPKVMGVERVRLWDSDPPWMQGGEGSGTQAQRDGHRHERRMHHLFDTQYEHAYMPSPWLKYRVRGEWNWCQPDGLLFNVAKGRCTILEAKLVHTPAAYFQLEHLYLPVVGKFLEGWELLTCEVVRWYKSSVRFPCEVKLVRGVEECKSKDFNVLVLQPGV